ncbi:MAG TPA: TetR/AcrR family transcriptional regulator [Streptosporangiaceae bacterium]|nr:TetR/AcrR family transcriptional regulator [Streptosporangiaceae bacterium]
MPRVRDQAARRKLLLEAAVAVINDRGPARMQMKDVADMAGMATGSVYYYYDNVDEILRHVHAMAFDRYYTARVQAISNLADAREKIRTMVDLGLPRPQDEPLSLALYQVIVAKARDPQHSDMITSLCGEQRGLYQQILDEGVAAGQFRPVIPTLNIAQNLISLEDGYGLGLSTGNHDYDFGQARLLLLQAAAHWTQCPELLDDAG